MKHEEIAYQLWARVDLMLSAKGFSTLRELSDSIGIDYNTMKSWRSRNLIPKTLEMYSMAQSLKTSIEELLTGKSYNEIPEEISDIVSALRIAPKEDHILVRRALRIPEKLKVTLNQKNA